jgi:putative lipoic acid-binding regulatory protein
MPDNNKLQMEYPCSWVYKIIGVDPDEMRCAVAEIIQDRHYEISLSRSSQTAQYTCLNVELTVESESHRKSLYETLKAHRAVKIIL